MAPGPEVTERGDINIVEREAKGGLVSYLKIEWNVLPYTLAHKLFRTLISLPRHHLNCASMIRAHWRIQNPRASNRAVFHLIVIVLTKRQNRTNRGTSDLHQALHAIQGIGPTCPYQT